MTRAPGIVAGAAMILLFAALMIVVMPAIQLQGTTRAPQGLEPYSEQAARGREVYVSLGCVYCHSQQPRDPSVAPDGERGWGRAAVPADFVYDSPHLLGSMRTGPDLLNIGARQPSSDWHLAHLYNPRAVSPGTPSRRRSCRASIRRIAVSAAAIAARSRGKVVSSHMPTEAIRMIPPTLRRNIDDLTHMCTKMLRRVGRR